MAGFNGKKLGLVVLAAASMSAAAFAHGGFGGFGRGAPPEMLQKYDADKDGKLNETERAALKQDMIKKYDLNGDGTLDETERAKRREEFVSSRFKALDTNNDGSLSLAEFQAGMSKHGRHGPRGER